MSVILHPQYDIYLEISLLEMTMLMRPDPDKSPFCLHVVHILRFQMRLCPLG